MKATQKIPNKETPMTKTDYTLISEALKHSRPDKDLGDDGVRRIHWMDTVQDMTDRLFMADPTLDRVSFETACGVHEELPPDFPDMARTFLPKKVVNDGWWGSKKEASK